ncbi:MAG: hypothetical protein AAF721_14340 [Myxococcota bacterium]
MTTRHSWVHVALAAPLCLFSVACDNDEEDGDSAADTGHDDHDDHGTDDDHGHDEDHGDETGHDHNEAEVITRVELTFTPDGGGDAIVAAFSDPDGDGGMSGTSDPIALAANTTYSVTVTFANELEDPAEDITGEIEEEAEEHQVFFAGDAVGGLLTHTYADMESTYGGNSVGDDLPVGLSNTIAAADAGTGSLMVQLQHLPEVNGDPVKVAGLADMFPSLPGEPDASVSFDVTVE